MSKNLNLSKLEFGSILTYSPRGYSDSERKSKTIMRAIKNDEFVLSPSILASEFISNIIREKMTTLPFAHFFETNPILVPIPNSSLIRPGTLWVPQRLAYAMHRNGLGKAVKEFLRRVVPLPKSATSLAMNRPKAAQHFGSRSSEDTIYATRNPLGR